MTDTCPTCGRPMEVVSDPGGEGTNHYTCKPCYELQERVTNAIEEVLETFSLADGDVGLMMARAVLATLEPELRRLEELEDALKWIANCESHLYTDQAGEFDGRPIMRLPDSLVPWAGPLASIFLTASKALEGATK